MKQDNQRQAVLYAYMAGIFDGEGSVGISKVTRDKKRPNWAPRYSAYVSFVNTDKESVELFRKTFTPTYQPIIEHQPPHTGYKTQYRWRTPGNKIVIEILETLLPYLRVKKARARLVIEYCKGKQVDGFKRRGGVPPKELRRREKYYSLLLTRPQRLNEEPRESVKR